MNRLYFVASRFCAPRPSTPDHPSCSRLNRDQAPFPEGGNHQLLASQGIDTVLEIGVQRIALQVHNTSNSPRDFGSLSAAELNSSLTLNVIARSRVIRIADGTELYASVHASDDHTRALTLTEWAANDAQALRDALGQFTQTLAIEVVVQMFDALPAVGAVGACTLGDPAPQNFLTPLDAPSISRVRLNTRVSDADAAAHNRLPLGGLRPWPLSNVTDDCGRRHGERITLHSTEHWCRGSWQLSHVLASVIEPEVCLQRQGVWSAMAFPFSLSSTAARHRRQVRHPHLLVCTTNAGRTDPCPFFLRGSRPLHVVRRCRRRC